MIQKQILEYVWIDGVGNLRSKIKIHSWDDQDEYDDAIIIVEHCEMWNFDGSSTDQSTGFLSDIVLNPVRLYKNNLINYPRSLFVFCECLNKDLTPHISNYRNKCKKTDFKYCENECLFGIEQEYLILERNNKPYLWLSTEDPGIGHQGPYYCGVGGDRSFGRTISDEHLKICLDAGINICGTNSEVLASQWEFQIGICDALTVSDDLYMARYLLHRVSERYNCSISFHPKPLMQWNGSGGHTNFSTKQMRDPEGIKYIYKACEKLKLTHLLHLLHYGNDNEKRLCGMYETSKIDNFSYGVSDRSCSIRIPLQVDKNRCGYLEDRRPAANLNPYIVTELLITSTLEIFI